VTKTDKNRIRYKGHMFHLCDRTHVRTHINGVIIVSGERD